MKTNQILWLFSLVLLLGSLCACGGGGSSAANIDNNSGNFTNSNVNVTNPPPNASVWAEQAYLKAANTVAGVGYGNSIAHDGDTLVVGAQSENSNQTTITNGTTASSDVSLSRAGAAYVYLRTGGIWVQQAYLKAANAHSINYFGTAVAISGETIAVSAYAEGSNQTTITNGTTASNDTSALGSGAVYVFKRTGSNWSQEAYVKPSNTGGGDRFGSGLSLDGDTLVVGAVFEASNQRTITNGAIASADNSLPRAGAAYVFVRSGTTWTQQAYIKPPNPNSENRFGNSVSISGDSIVVTSVWESSNQTTITNGTTASADNSASHAGAAYVFTRTGTSWAQQAYLKASNAESNDAFGVSAAINNDTIVVGANGESSNQTSVTNGATASANNSSPNAGAAYVFVRQGGTWSQQAYLKAANSASNNWFGYRVAIDGDVIAVGSQQENSNQATISNDSTASADTSATHAGAVYVFKRTGSDWAQQAYIKPTNAGANQLFGSGVSIKQNTLAVGAYGESSAQNFITNGAAASTDTSASSAGASYIFTYQ
jgi:FG-GAP repeat